MLRRPARRRPAIPSAAAAAALAAACLTVPAAAQAPAPAPTPSPTPAPRPLPPPESLSKSAAAAAKRAGAGATATSAAARISGAAAPRGSGGGEATGRTEIVSGIVAGNAPGWLDIQTGRAPSLPLPPGGGLAQAYDGAAAAWAERVTRDGPVVRFRVTAKTLFFRGGVRVTAAAFPVGASAAVKPRALPGGQRMAAIVAESPAEVLALYRDSLTLWRGRVADVARAGSEFVLDRDDGARRAVYGDAGTTVHKRRRTSPGLVDLAPGDLVTVRLRKNVFVPPGYRVADDITVAAP